MPNGLCMPCPAGYKRSRSTPVLEISGDENQPLICYPSPPGDIALGRGNKECSRCPAGTVSLPWGSRECTKCPSGLVAKTVPEFFGGSSCVNPLTNENPPSMSAPYPVKVCDGNTVNYRRFLNDTCDCVSALFSHQLVNGKCERCPLGTIGRYGIAGCEPCPAGTFSTEEGSMSCDNCSPGTFSSTGAIRCRPCPKGMTSYIPGSANCVEPGGLAGKK